MLTAKQVDNACRKGEKVYATVKGKRRRVMGVNLSQSTKPFYFVSLWADLQWWWVEPATIKIVEKGAVWQIKKEKLWQKE